MRYFYYTKKNFTRSISLEELGCKCFIINNIEDLKPHLNSIKKLIEDFNSYIEWDKMFTSDDVVNRIKKGEVLFITYCKSNPVGYCFSNNGWMYNLFITRLLPHPPKLFLSLCDKVIEYNTQRYDISGYEMEDWNKPILFITKQLGGIETDISLKSNLVT